MDGAVCSLWKSKFEKDLVFMSMNLFKLLDKEKCVALNLSIDKNCAVLCTLAEAQINNAFKYSTLKLVVDGNAVYKVNRKSYKLSQNEYLLSNGGQDGVGIIDSKKDVSQFCIHLKPSFINDTYNAIASADHVEPDMPLDASSDFKLFENSYHLNNSTIVSKLLWPLAAMIKGGRAHDIHLDEEWLLKLAEAIVLNEKNIKRSLSGLNTVRRTTRDEIMKRLLIGKDYMDSCFMDDPKIGEVAKIALMSEFFFYRNFKLAFRTTPYQYILDKKISLAKELMHHEKMTLAEIASSCGFPDIYTFSKAFKRKCGFAPSQTRGFYNKGLSADHICCNTIFCDLTRQGHGHACYSQAQSVTQEKIFDERFK
jgi:AraC-like DNA-binding protein